jgi:hypothetical protein
LTTWFTGRVPARYLARNLISPILFKGFSLSPLPEALDGVPVDKVSNGGIKPA